MNIYIVWGEVLANVVDKLPQDEVAEELYNELLQAYMGVHGGRSKQVLEHKMESLMKKGLSRSEAINMLADKEKLGDIIEIEDQLTHLLTYLLTENWKIIIPIPYLILVFSFIAIRIQIISGNYSYASLAFSFLMFWSSFFISIPLTIILLIRGIMLRSKKTKRITKYCADCGHTISLDDTFCEFCGKKVKEEKIDPIKLYKKLSNYYRDFYGSSNRFEKEIETYIKQGLSRNDAILEIAKKKDFIEVE
jgi:hypothetical protein